jgi:hypothetical protein
MSVDSSGRKKLFTSWLVLEVLKAEVHVEQLIAQVQVFQALNVIHDQGLAGNLGEDSKRIE